MGNHLFGNRMSAFDIFVISAVSFNMGAGQLETFPALCILVVAVIISALLTNIFAS